MVHANRKTMVLGPATQLCLQRAHPAPSWAVPFLRILITGLDLREMISQCPCGVQKHYQRPKGPWRIQSNLFAPQTAPRKYNDSLRSPRGQTSAQNFLDPNPQFSALDCPRHFCTHTCLECVTLLGFTNTAQGKYSFLYSN